MRTLKILLFLFIVAFFTNRIFLFDAIMGGLVFSFVFLFGMLFFVHALQVFFLIVQESDRQIEEFNKQLAFLDCSNCELLSNSNSYKAIQRLYDLEGFDQNG